MDAGRGGRGGGWAQQDARGVPGLGRPARRQPWRRPRDRATRVGRVGADGRRRFGWGGCCAPRAAGRGRFGAARPRRLARVTLVYMNSVGCACLLACMLPVCHGQRPVLYLSALGCGCPGRQGLAVRGGRWVVGGETARPALWERAAHPHLVPSRTPFPPSSPHPPSLQPTAPGPHLPPCDRV